MDQPPVLWIPGRLPDLNTIISAKLNVYLPSNFSGRIMPAKLPNEWMKIKKRWHEIIDRLCQEQDFACPGSGYFNFFLIEENRRRDKDNVGAGAQKVIQDALVARGSLFNDGWKAILGYRHFFAVNPDKSGVYLVITDRQCLTDEQAGAFLGKISMQPCLLEEKAG